MLALQLLNARMFNYVHLDILVIYLEEGNHVHIVHLFIWEESLTNYLHQVMVY